MRILNVSVDEELMRIRTAVLTQAGYEVVPATNWLEVYTACKESRDIHLVIIGQVLPNSEKLRVMETVKELCPTVPILEIYQSGRRKVDELSNKEIEYDSDPNSLVREVNRMLKQDTGGHSSPEAGEHPGRR